MLFPMVQRYKFESKSQLRSHSLFAKVCCFQWFKGTNLKANHNESPILRAASFAVSNGSKVQIWKQITTVDYELLWNRALFPMVQRYKFESKSQLWFRPLRRWRAVSNGSKVQIWKQITTTLFIVLLWLVLFPMVQRYKFESKSQRIATMVII